LLTVHPKADDDTAPTVKGKPVVSFRNCVPKSCTLDMVRPWLRDPALRNARDSNAMLRAVAEALLDGGLGSVDFRLRNLLRNVHGRWRCRPGISGSQQA
jgi:hypothetical protein